jgi:hypothetical protein
MEDEEFLDIVEGFDNDELAMLEGILAAGAVTELTPAEEVTEKELDIVDFLRIRFEYLTEDNLTLVKQLNEDSLTRLTMLIDYLSLYFQDSWDIEISDCFIFKIKFDKLVLSNTNGITHEIRDLFIRIMFNFNIGLIGSVSGTRSTFIEAERELGYVHSHINSDGGDINNIGFINFCLGSSELGVTVVKMNDHKNVNEYYINKLLLGIISLVSWESLEGTPYKHMSRLLNHINEGGSNSGQIHGEMRNLGFHDSSVRYEDNRINKILRTLTITDATNFLKSLSKYMKVRNVNWQTNEADISLDEDSLISDALRINTDPEITSAWLDLFKFICRFNIIYYKVNSYYKNVDHTLERTLEDVRSQYLQLTEEKAEDNEDNSLSPIASYVSGVKYKGNYLNVNVYNNSFIYSENKNIEVSNNYKKVAFERVLEGSFEVSPVFKSSVIEYYRMMFFNINLMNLIKNESN